MQTCIHTNTHTAVRGHAGTLIHTHACTHRQWHTPKTEAHQTLQNVVMPIQHIDWWLCCSERILRRGEAAWPVIAGRRGNKQNSNCPILHRFQVCAGLYSQIKSSTTTIVSRANCPSPLQLFTPTLRTTAWRTHKEISIITIMFYCHIHWIDVVKCVFLPNLVSEDFVLFCTYSISETLHLVWYVSYVMY